MKGKAEIPVRLALGALLALYPLWAWYGLDRWGLTPVAGALAALALARALVRRSPTDFGLFAAAAALAAASALLGREEPVRLYPVAVSVLLLWAFGTSLLPGRMPMVERFARLREKDLPPEAVRWCRGVTRVWCGFFVLNGSIALVTVFLDREWWTLWNGCLSYGAIGLLFGGEWIVRRIAMRRPRV